MPRNWSYRTVSTGDLRHRVTFQAAQKAPDGRGGWITTWVDVSTVWAAVQALRPFERIQAQQTQTGVTHQVITRFRNGLSASMRIAYDGRYLYIQGPPVDPDGKRRWLQMLCEEREE